MVKQINKWLFFTCIVIALLVLAALLIQTFVKGVGFLHQISLQISSSSIPSQAGAR